MWCMGTKNRRYCTMHKKVLYNIKKIKKMWGGEGEGQYLNPKHSFFWGGGSGWGVQGGCERRIEVFGKIHKKIGGGGGQVGGSGWWGWGQGGCERKVGGRV